MGSEFWNCVDFSPYERARHYRAMAQRMERDARNAGSKKIRAAYDVLAQEWRDLAEKVEAGCRETVLIEVGDARLADLLRRAV